ncbi:hypothetical protein B0H13DRAFT_726582 [Mycena leptocephala]|nr:hypothetical protein B0H13DRAFT_726582 [Mycena leptocephala]
MSSDDSCTAATNPNTYMPLRVASVFVVLVCATTGTLFPVLARRSKWLHVPKSPTPFPTSLKPCNWPIHNSEASGAERT